LDVADQTEDSEAVEILKHRLESPLPSARSGCSPNFLVVPSSSA